MRGGTGCQTDKRGRNEGLSPRARGNPSLMNNKSHPMRTIPACAGEPCFEAGLVLPLKDYPRVRGGTLRNDFSDN